MIQSAYLAERLAREYAQDAQRRVEHDRLIRLARSPRERQQLSVRRILGSLMHFANRQRGNAPVSG